MGTRVLVVDDDVHLGRALNELLTQAGYEATVAHSAEEALDRLREQTFHLVLTDLQLPGRNGISLIKTIHEACPETKCVLITAHGSTRTGPARTSRSMSPDSRRLTSTRARRLGSARASSAPGRAPRMRVTRRCRQRLASSRACWRASVFLTGGSDPSDPPALHGVHMGISVMQRESHRRPSSRS